MKFLVIVLVVLTICDLACSVVLHDKRSVDHLISSTNLGATATFGEREVEKCLAEGNPSWKCYSEQSGINPDWSCSSTALPVLAGVLPADLEVFPAGVIAQERGNLAPKEYRKLKTTVRTDVVAQWQERWQNNTDGRELYSFFPDVAVRLSSDWIEPDYVVSQVLTGHGCFRQRLHKLGLCESAECPCGEDNESRDHALWECKLYEEERSEMLDSLERTIVGPVFHEELISRRQNFEALRKFAHKWHTTRREH